MPPWALLTLFPERQGPCFLNALPASLASATWRGWAWPGAHGMEKNSLGPHLSLIIMRLSVIFLFKLPSKSRENHPLQVQNLREVILRGAPPLCVAVRWHSL